MGKNLYFSKSQLDKMKRKDLIRIASYYKLGFDKKATKKQLQELIWNEFVIPEIVGGIAEEEIQKSVRIRRIEESQK